MHCEINEESPSSFCSWKERDGKGRWRRRRRSRKRLGNPRKHRRSGRGIRGKRMHFCGKEMEMTILYPSFDLIIPRDVFVNILIFKLIVKFIHISSLFFHIYIWVLFHVVLKKDQNWKTWWRILNQIKCSGKTLKRTQIIWKLAFEYA